MSRLRSFVSILIIISLPFMLISCGSSGGSGDSVSSSMGTAAVFIKDASDHRNMIVLFYASIKPPWNQAL